MSKDEKARIVRLQAALKIARDGLKEIADGDCYWPPHSARAFLELIEERMMKQ